MMKPPRLLLLLLLVLAAPDKVVLSEEGLEEPISRRHDREEGVGLGDDEPVVCVGRG